MFVSSLHLRSKDVFSVKDSVSSELEQTVSDLGWILSALQPRDLSNPRSMLGNSSAPWHVNFSTSSTMQEM